MDLKRLHPCQLLGRAAAEHRADVGEVVDVTADVDVRRAHGIGLARLREIIDEAARLLLDRGHGREWEVLWEAGLPERDDLARAAEDGPLGPPDGKDLIAAPEAVAPEAADALRTARLRPRLAGHAVHQREGLAQLDPAVDRQPEFPPPRHRRKADADLLGMLRRQRLEQRQPAQRAEAPVHAAKLRRDQKFTCPNALFHIPYSCFAPFRHIFYYHNTGWHGGQPRGPSGAKFQRGKPVRNTCFLRALMLGYA